MMPRPPEPALARTPALPRRRLLIAAGACLGMGAGTGPALAARAPDLPAPVSLPGALAAALARSEPLVLMASLAGCPYCHVVREHYLWPLARAGAAVVQIDFRSAAAVHGWQGRETTQGALVQALGIGVAPTVLFFGPAAREVAERLEGASLPDFYGAYLDDRMAQARAAVRA